MPANTQERDLLHVKEAALALRVSESTVRRAIHAGQLEALALGEHGRYRIRRAALERFLRPTTAEGEEA